MRWVFYALFLFNLGFFVFGFFVINPNAELQLIEPSPIKHERGGNGVVLLSERKSLAFSPAISREIAGGEIKSSEPNVDADVSPRFEAQNSLPPKCYKIGPFESNMAAESYQLKSGFVDGFARIDEQPEAIDTKFWVYIPPAYTKEEALVTLRSLQVSGVDSFVVLKGQFMNAVSLGTFKKSESAEALKAKVSALGYSVEVEMQEIVRKSFWLYLKALEIEQQKAIESPVQSGPHLSVFSCEMFAQDKIFP